MYVCAGRQVKQVDVVTALLQVQTSTINNIAGNQNLAHVQQIEVFHKIRFLTLDKVRGQHTGINTKEYKKLTDNQLLQWVEYPDNCFLFVFNDLVGYIGNQSTQSG